MKKIASCFLFISIHFLATAQFNAAKDPFLTKTLKGESFQKINAKTAHGNISVSEATGTEARIEMYARANGDIKKELSKEEIQERLDKYYTLEISVSGNQLTAIAKRKTDLADWRKLLSISFRIYTPKKVDTDLGTSHGNIEISGVEGIHDVSTSHGNLDIKNIHGKLSGETSHGNISISDCANYVEVNTSHGNIDATNCEGTIKLVTSKGDVQLNKLKGKIHSETSHGNIGGSKLEGELSANTSHGNIDLENLFCSLETSTNHGNITVSVEQLNGSISMENSHGNISIRLPKEKGANLDLRGKGIKVDAMENFNGSKEERSMKGTVNGGGATVRAATTKGTINVDFR